MKYTRIYSDKDGNTQFCEEEAPLKSNGEIGKLSQPFRVKELFFRETDPEYDYDFHNAPQKQFIILLDGQIEIASSLGEKRIFKGGDILLMENVEGKGHSTKAINDIVRRSIFITIP